MAAVTWDQLTGYSWDQLATWDNPLPGGALLPSVFTNGRAVVEAAFGADIHAIDDTLFTWTDVTADVMHGARVSISVGRADETSTTQPASCSFTLLNNAGNYTPYRPASTHYPNVRRNTPVRVTLDAGTGGHVVFYGFAVGFTPGWDSTADLAIVSVVASGSLRRLTQGKTPLRSPLYRAVSVVNPIAYWPMEEGSGALKILSGVAGGPALAVTGTIALGATGPAGAVAAVDFSGGGKVTSAVTGGSPLGAIEVGFTIKATGLGTTCTPVEFRTSTNLLIYVQVLATSVKVSIQASSSTSTATSTRTITETWHEIQVSLLQAGADIDVGITVDGTFQYFASARAATTLGVIANITAGADTKISANKNFSLGHLYVLNPSGVVPGDAGAIAAAVGGYVGEDPVTRILRIADEEGLSIGTQNTSTTTMGPQPVAALVDILRDCETADGGVLFDGFTFGLVYSARSYAYNRGISMTVDMANRELAVPFAPVDDDQRTRNDMTVSRTGGSSGRYIQTSGALGTDAVGTYDGSLTVNVDTDDPLVDHAAWLVHFGTVEGLRYPTLRLDLAAVPTIAAAFLAASYIGWHLRVKNPATIAGEHPPDDLELVIEGYTLTFDITSLDVVLNCSPASPWQIFTLDSTTLGRLESSTSTVHAGGVTSGAASMLVDTAAGDQLWTTTATRPADFPFDIGVAGERMTCTAIVGASSPQTFTVTRSVNGVVAAHNAGDNVRLWIRSALAL